MPNNVKTYDESDDLEDHLKIFQAAAKVEQWAMPTWCHVFNSTLTGSARVWFDDLPPESVDNYDDLKKAFLVNFLQQKKCIKDPVETHHIKQRKGESTEDFVQRFKDEMDEMMRVTTAFLKGEVAVFNHVRKKTLPVWKQQEAERKQNFESRGDSGINKEQSGDAPSGSKESNGYSYRTPHWFQRINHMANGTNIAASKNKGCGGFNLYMDEFCGGEITISLQWDHRQARGEENSSSPVNSS
ncbi:reverse transcriptase domain-containing protein [Tanacetum coccineum]|uniref:Reverse transcriptase domain-containing protein n=1 Tax=Tanacetum coccineum TaxID=301880 RepID=A0ABQ5B1T3_9ASTR